MNKRILAIFLVLCMMLSMAACGEKAPASTEAPAVGATNAETPADTTPPETSSAFEEVTDSIPLGGEVINVANNGFNGFFAPKSQTTAVETCWPALETLAYLDHNQEWQPGLATSWEIDNEALTVTLHLREGVTFHNGDPFNSEDAAWSLNVRNEFGTASNIGNPVSIEAVDDYTVVVTYETFSLDYLNWLLPQFMYSKQAYDEHDADWMMNNIVGTGPYIMKEFIPDDSLTFVKWDGYWGEPGYVDSFTWKVIADPTARVAAFINGEVDRLLGTDATALQMLEGAGFKAFDGGNQTGSQFYIIPITLDPDAALSNVEVRKAIYKYAIDWDAMAEALGGGTYFHTDAYGVTGVPYYSEDLEFTTGPDYEKAKQIIADAGYPDGFETTIYYGSNNPVNASIATYIQAELAKIGIQVECSPQDGTVLSSEYSSGKAAKTGMLISGLYFTPLQTQRLNQQHNPVRGNQTAIITWSDEMKDLYNILISAKTQEEQNTAMYNYVKQFIEVESDYWPVFNSKIIEFYQDWCHYSVDAKAGSAGYNPHEIWVDEH